MAVSGALIAEDKNSPQQPAVTESAASVADTAPHLVFEKILHDFGTVKQGAQPKHNFKFRNAGNADLIIGNVRTTCGCTAALASTGPYHPGETGTVDVTYNSSGKYGFVLKEAKIESNDPSSPQTVTMQGVVIASDHPMKNTGETLFGPAPTAIQHRQRERWEKNCTTRPVTCATISCRKKKEIYCARQKFIVQHSQDQTAQNRRNT